MNIEEALKALAAADARREAGADVEARLIKVYRRRRSRRLPWVVGAAAAAVLVLAFLRIHLPIALPDKTVVGRAPSPAADAHVGLSVEPKKPARGPAADPGILPTTEFSTEFFPLLEIAPPFERGELVRVTLPAAAMRRVGIPVREDLLQQPVEAEILVGQEGLARAIRFVRFEQ